MVLQDQAGHTVVTLQSQVHAELPKTSFESKAHSRPNFGAVSPLEADTRKPCIFSVSQTETELDKSRVPNRSNSLVVQCCDYHKPAGKFLTSTCSSFASVPSVYAIRRRMTSGFWPCMLFVTCSCCVAFPAPIGASVEPDAGSSLSCMNFGTAACEPPMPHL